MNLYIVGAGGFGRETLDAAIAYGSPVTNFLDEHKAGETIRGLPVLKPDVPTEGDYVVAIANPVVRQRLASQLEAQGLRPRTVIHPRSIIGPDTTIGQGSVILGGAHVSSSVILGRHVQINYNATIGHDAVIDDYATIYPGANVSGSVHLCQGVTMGTNSCVIQRLTIGQGTFVGAGAVVVRDIPGGLVVKGVPAHRVTRGS
jgi:sugar O-acyltransferase (sialic acid O-acetyltransferase NeuD family)